MKNKNKKRPVEAFKKDFIKLLVKYEGIVVASDVRGNLIAYDGMERELLPCSSREAIEFALVNPL